MRVAIAAALSFLLTGCALLDKLASQKEAAAPAPRAATATPNHISPAEELVAYLARLKSLNESALNAEATRQRQAAQKDTSELARLKAAMAMTIAAQAEEGDILALVDPLAKKDSRIDVDVRAMASFLQGIAQERRRLKESAAASGARLRDAQRARDTEKQRADALHERAAQLQQKLDALTELEKSLSDRQSPPR
jgi:hypothetical protein